MTVDNGNNMPFWYFEKKELRNTPSILDGIEYETECRYRKEGARFIIDTGTKMDLGYNTMATGVVYFHRFYMYHSFKNFPRYVTACCCLFLAGKVEETPKKCKDIIKTARLLLTDAKFATFGEDPKEEVMVLERILLQTIKFDLQVEHPYSFLLKYAKCLKGDKTKLHKMVQMAWTFVNDSLCTTLSLQWEPEVIAVALMYLAGKLSKFEVIDWVGRTTKHLRWWDMFVEDVTMDLLEDICHQVLDLYSPQTPVTPDSPPPVRSPIVKQESSRQGTSPQISTASPSTSALPPKMVKTEKVSSNGEKIPVLGSTSISEVKSNNGDTSHYPLPSNFNQSTTPNFSPYPASIPVRAPINSFPPSTYPPSYPPAPPSGSQYYSQPPNYYPPTGPS
uniref:Cyclin-K n=1 Tax=Clastoptera arizonana TaxID=38151 RepID=A0A1B6BWG7_9HEMI